MSCDECNEVLQSCPPYANLHSVQQLKNIVCAPCVATVDSGTDSILFFAEGFNEVIDPCCDFLTIFEGNNVWYSVDGTTWVKLNTTGVETLLIHDETKANNLSGSFDITIPSGYDEIIIKGQFRCTDTTHYILGVRFNGDNTLGNYLGGYNWGNGSSSDGANGKPGIIAQIAASSAPANHFMPVDANLYNYEATNMQKFIFAKNVGYVGTTWYNATGGTTWLNTSTAITSMSVVTANVSTGATGGAFLQNSWLKAWAVRR